MLMQSTATSNFDPPNFKTILPLPVLLQGYREILASLYDASAYYERCDRSLLQWHARKPQKPPQIPLGIMLGILVRSIVRQGLLSSYRGAYWKFLFRLVTHWPRDPRKFGMGFAMLLSGHHFIRYAKNVVAQVDTELRKCRIENEPVRLGGETVAC